MSLFGGFFGGNKSSSSSVANDNRVGAEGGGIAVGQDGSVVINNESPEVVDLTRTLVEEAFNFAKESQNSFKDQSAGALATVEAAVGQTPGFGPESFQKMTGVIALAGVAALIVWKTA